MDFEKELTRPERVQLWEAGVPLGMSFKKFGSPGQLKQQLKKAGTPGSAMMIELMLGDIWGKICDRRLVALGHRVRPKTSNGPIIVPSDVFSVGPDFLRAFEQDEVKASGWKFERVTVLEMDRFLSIIDEIQKANTETSQPSARKDSVKRSEITEKTKRGGGRKNIYPKAEAIFKELFEIYPHLRDEVAAKITPYFNPMYREHYFSEGEKYAEISERTIRTHLNAFRKKSEKTGRN